MDALTAMKQALEALELIYKTMPDSLEVSQTITNLRTAIEEINKWNPDTKDLRIADLKAEVMTLRAKLEEVACIHGILHIRDGGIVASSIKDPLENGDYYLIKKDFRK